MDYRLKAMERTLQDMDRFNKNLQRVLVRIEQKMGTVDDRVDEALNQFSTNTAPQSPLYQELNQFSP